MFSFQFLCIFSCFWIYNYKNKFIFIIFIDILCRFLFLFIWIPICFINGLLICVLLLFFLFLLLWLWLLVSQPLGIEHDLPWRTMRQLLVFPTVLRNRILYPDHCWSEQGSCRCEQIIQVFNVMMMLGENLFSPIPFYIQLSSENRCPWHAHVWNITVVPSQLVVNLFLATRWPVSSSCLVDLDNTAAQRKPPKAYCADINSCQFFIMYSEFFYLKATECLKFNNCTSAADVHLSAWLEDNWHVRRVAQYEYTYFLTPTPSNSPCQPTNRRRSRIHTAVIAHDT